MSSKFQCSHRCMIVMVKRLSHAREIKIQAGINLSRTSTPCLRQLHQRQFLTKNQEYRRSSNTLFLLILPRIFIDANSLRFLVVLVILILILDSRFALDLAARSLGLGNATRLDCYPWKSVQSISPIRRNVVVHTILLHRTNTLLSATTTFRRSSRDIASNSVFFHSSGFFLDLSHLVFKRVLGHVFAVETGDFNNVDLCCC